MFYYNTFVNSEVEGSIGNYQKHYLKHLKQKLAKCFCFLC